MSSTFIREKRQWGGSERRKGGRKEQEEGLEITICVGRKKKDGKRELFNSRFDGHVAEGVRGSYKKFKKKKTGRKILDRHKRLERRTNRHKEKGVSVGKKEKEDTQGGEKQ